MIKLEREAVLVKPEQIKPSSKKFEVLGVINPAAVRTDNGEIVLYIRVIEKLKKHESKNHEYAPRLVGEKKFKIKIDKFSKKEIKTSSELDIVFQNDTKRLKFISHFRRVVLDSSGFKIKSIEKKPSFYGLAWDGELGIEDPRITKIKNLYIMTYVALSRAGNISTSLAISNDCKQWYRRGVIFGHQNKDVVIFPETIDNNYIAINRPEGNFEFTSAHMWLAYSQNLEYWGKNSSFLISKKKSWDSERIGAGPPPIRTKKGWLFIYHGVISKKIKQKQSLTEYLKSFIEKEPEEELKRDIYCAGAILLDIKNPKKILAKSPNPIIWPIKKYEKGTFEDKNVVFPTGIVLEEKTNSALLFSGGGDVVTTVKKISLDEIFGAMKKFR